MDVSMLWGSDMPFRRGWLLALLFLSGCTGVPVVAGGELERRYDFTRGPVTAWTFGTADYSALTAPAEVDTAFVDAPDPFAGTGLLLAGTNRSDDLLVYARTRIAGLEPRRAYRVSVRVVLLTDAPSGCAGVGGAPGESVWVIAAAGPIEPVTVLVDGEYRVNMQRGNQGQRGPASLVLGTIGNVGSTCSVRQWEAKTLQSGLDQSLVVNTAADGTAWLLLGIDSGFEARSGVYLRSIELQLTP